MKFAAVLLLVAYAAAYVRYDGYQVIRVIPKNVNELELLMQIHNDNLDKLSFWKEPRMVGRFVDIMTTPDFADDLKSLILMNGMEFTINVENIQDQIDQEREAMSSRPGIDVEGFNYEIYHTYDEINQWVDEFVATYPTISSVFTIGSSYEGRPLRGVKIGTSTATVSSLFLEGGIHAREWISPATMLYMTQLFADGYGVDQKTTELVDKLNWYMLPVLNADGYAHTHDVNGDRMWRKTRSPNDGSTCIGTDGNRNFDYMWGGEGSSGIPCASTYRGSHPHSEIEIDSVTKFILQDPSFKAFVDFHSYGQIWMCPWGYTFDSTEHLEYQNTSNKRCVEALTAVHGTEYVYGQSATMYLTSGGSEDWGYGSAGIVLTHVVELRGDSFILPAEEIIPSGEETFAAIRALGDTVLESETLPEANIRMT
uniref:Carboxypeptidase A2-like n=1 Tax=Saccoglossus kowalevskii TaxID=10224 RepID=A0ABM0LX81_SACKO|nr:PREDICTED: carboxypeptidase A2-like [Saccoglossus kowalevskii]